MKSLFSIVNTYYKLTKLAKTEEDDIIPSEVGMNKFLITALEKMFISNLFPILSKNDIIRFYNSNKDTINNIRRSPLFQFADPVFLGRGADGVVFKIGKSAILKIFQSEAAYQDALNQVKVLHKNKPFASTEAMIYDVGVLGYFKGATLYYYIMQLMSPVESEEADYDAMKNKRLLAKLINETVAHAEYFMSTIPHLVRAEIFDYLKGEERSNEDINSAIKNIINEFRKSINNQQFKFYHNDKSHIVSIKDAEKALINKMGLNPKFLDKLAEEVMIKLLTNRADLHTGNIGVTSDGMLRFFDPKFH